MLGMDDSRHKNFICALGVKGDRVSAKVFYYN